VAPHIVLEEIGVPFSLALVSTADGSTRSPEHLRLNPKGRVPVLTTGDAVWTETPAILLHLALAHPAARLLPDEPDGIVRCVEWFNWLSGAVHAVAIRQIWRPEGFVCDGASRAGVIEKGKENLAAAFALIEARIADTDWAVGRSYSIVDAYLLVFYRWGDRIGFDMRGWYAAWTRHARRLLERPAVQRALSREAISVWE
jgi:glutathione S-transferase